MAYQIGTYTDPWYLDMSDAQILARCKARDIRALSIRQPFAHMIMESSKTEEYRSRGCKFRGPVAIYASERIADQYTYVGSDVGVIIGMVTITGSVEYGYQDHGWQLSHPRRFRTPVNRPAGRHPQPAFWRPWPEYHDDLLDRADSALARIPPTKSVKYGVFYVEGTSKQARWYGVRHRTRRSANKARRSLGKAGARYRLTVLPLPGIDLDRLPAMSDLLDWHKHKRVAESVSDYLERIRDME